MRFGLVLHLLALLVLPVERCVTWSNVKRNALPISRGAIGVKDSLRQFLLERVFLHGLLIDGDPEAGSGVGPHDATLLLDGESFLHYILPPRDVVVYGLANDVARLGEAKLQRRRRAHR